MTKPASLSPEFITVENNEISLNVAVQGDGPLVVFVHGWPELWYSWRHQMAYFATNGYRVAAMDVRGYGGSSNPEAIEAYSMVKLTGDVASVIQALNGDEPAIVVGHDWGAPIAWNTARLHPQHVRAVAGLSVPYTPVGETNSLALWRERYTDQGRFFYQVYFDDNRGGAEAELGADSKRSLRMIYFSAAGDRDGSPGLTADKPADAGMLDGLVDPDPFPQWCSPADFEVYGEAFDKSGWHGPLNRYRAQPIDANEIGPMPGGQLRQPAAFIGGEQDPVRDFVPDFDMYSLAPLACQDFRGSTIIPGAGHWVQQEAPDETNRALATFFATL